MVVWVFHSLRGNATNHSIGLFDSDYTVDAFGNRGWQLRDAWHVEDLTEREQVADYEVIERVQQEGPQPPVPETKPALREHYRSKKKKQISLRVARQNKRFPHWRGTAQRRGPIRVYSNFTPRDDGAIFLEQQ